MWKCNKTQDIKKKSVLKIRLISFYFAQERNIVSGYLKVYFMKCKKLFYLDVFLAYCSHICHSFQDTFERITRMMKADVFLDIYAFRKKMHFKNVPLHRYPLRNEFYPNNFCVVSFVWWWVICNKRKAFYDLLRVTT